MTTIEYTYPSQYPRLEQARPPSAQESAETALWGEDGFTFGDLLDIVNPLQQLPVVSTVYREISGETISTVSRLAGGALLGGPIGFLVAALSAGLEAATGDDLGGHVFALFDGGSTADRRYASTQYQKTQELS